MEKHKGKTVLITGGTTGIGLAAAKLFISEGARVIVTGRTAKRSRPLRLSSAIMLS